jgi:GNAT superfamily N-acetyltransferase
MSITIRPFRYDEADYQELAAMRNAVYPDYPIAASEWRRWDERREARLTFCRLIAELDGRPVGGLVFENNAWAYHPQKFQLGVWVHPDHRRRGIGGELYKRLQAELEPYEPITLRHTVREDYVEGLRFAERRGFAEELRSWESRLDVAAFDPAPFAEAEAKVRAQGITITTVGELMERDPELWPKLYELDTAATIDVPLPEPLTPPAYEAWLKHFQDNPGLLPEGFFVALDGGSQDEAKPLRYVGLSSLWRRESSPDLETGFTGTLREYRRKGIALALKLRAIDYARRSGAPVIRTENLSVNRPMLSINEALGFVKQPAWITVLKQLRAE